MKRMIDAEHLMNRVEARYKTGDSWYDLVKVKALIESEPTVYPDKHQLAEVVLIFIIALLMTALLINRGVIH